jgi:hypothetical protein
LHTGQHKYAATRRFAEPASRVRFD